MNPTLPPNANLTQLKHQAKDLLKQHRSGDAEACAVLRRLPSLADADDAAVLAREMKLHDVQYALALMYGFTSWDALRRHIEGGRAPSAGCVVRENGRVWIEGIPELAYGKSGVTTYAGALEAALAATPHPYSYDDIMGYTGLAFRTRWYKRLDTPGWCPSSAVGEMEPEIRKTEAATGWRFEFAARMDQEEDPHMEDFGAGMAACIEAGFPIVGYPDRRLLDCAVAYGHEMREDGRYFLWEGYSDRLSGWKHETETGPMQLLLARHEAPAGQRASLRRALTEDWTQRAHSVDNPAKGVEAESRYGAYALETWADDLARHDTFTDEERGSLFFVSWYVHSTLICARATAARFLNKQAQTLDGDLAAALQRAASLYGATSAMAKRAQQEGAFAPPFAPDGREKWTPEVRQLEIDTLQRVQAQDAAAERELHAALRAMDAEEHPARNG